MQSKLPIAVLCGALLMTLAACGGSGDGARITELETELAAEQEAREQAEDQAAEAEEKRQEEETARKEAEAEALRAEQEAEQAEADRLAAQEAADEAEAQRQAAEAERQRLAAAAEERRKADAAERARTAIAGHTSTDANTALDPLAVNTDAIEYGEPPPVTNPAGPFTTSMGRSGSWSTTSLTANREPTRDMVEIYTDVEAPERELFSGSPLNTASVGGPGSPREVIDGTAAVVGWVEITTANHSLIATSGSFPRDSGPAQPFTLTDRGEYTVEQRARNTDDDPNNNVSIPADYTGPYRDESRFPDQWAFETSGLLQGASGRYRCDSDTAPTATACTVQNNGGSFTFVGDWDFIPSSGSVRIVVPDAEYMWFGVWARQTVRLATPPEQPTELWRFDARHGGTAEVTTLTGATGSATYDGPAAGRYAVYEPDTGDSGIGSFTASATLQADFETDMVSGKITGFSNDPSWSLALKQGEITDTGTVGNAETDQQENPIGVTWTIDGVPDDSGSWEAKFYNNLETDGGTITYQPHGIAGTFEATYDPSGVGARAAVIGGFGAHRP